MTKALLIQDASQGLFASVSGKIGFLCTDSCFCCLSFICKLINFDVSYHALVCLSRYDKLSFCTASTFVRTSSQCQEIKFFVFLSCQAHSYEKFYIDPFPPRKRIQILTFTGYSFLFFFFLSKKYWLQRPFYVDMAISKCSKHV